jgi:hypothetical protein
VLPLAIRPFLKQLSPDVIGVSSYALLFVALALGQRAVLQIGQWARMTALGLLGAGVTVVVLMPLLDLTLKISEAVVVVIAFGAGGLVIGTAQARCISTSVRQRQWAALVTASWSFGAALAFALYPSSWLPGHLPGAFPGRLELTTIVRLLPIYGLTTALMLPRLIQTRSVQRAEVATR